jgi:hypothetical protein
LKIITYDAISTYRVPGIGRSLREVANNFGLVPTISINDLIRTADLRVPQIEYFNIGGKVNINVNINEPETTLSWKVNNCENACTKNIRTNPDRPDSNFSDVKSQGSADITVHGKTEYTLSATRLDTSQTSEARVTADFVIEG